MASFNSSAASSSRQTVQWTYDVFLSFRGEDTRLNFVDHLYAALSRTGIMAYKDDENLGRGEPISPTLLNAIEESRCAVVVFSENYANSSWCLDELAKIMECCQDQMGKKVLPVFYHVDPSDVRGLKRSFSAAFQQHDEKFRGETEKLSRWREALVTASNISGWHVSKTVNEGADLEAADGGLVSDLILFANDRVAATAKGDGDRVAATARGDGDDGSDGERRRRWRQWWRRRRCSDGGRKATVGGGDDDDGDGDNDGDGGRDGDGDDDGDGGGDDDGDDGGGDGDGSFQMIDHEAQYGVGKYGVRWWWSQIWKRLMVVWSQIWKRLDGGLNYEEVKDEDGGRWWRWEVMEVGGGIGFGGESKVINEIIQVILDGVQTYGNENGLVGIESHMDVLNSYFGPEATEEVRVIGIYGMGGIGKTTIAQAVFQKFAYMFDGNSFVSNVREHGATERGIRLLQEKILRKILVTLNAFEIWFPEHGADMIRTRLSKKKVLLVLDDVDNVKQLQFLAATHEWFGPGSRIILTTRDEHLLADAHFKYKPNCLLKDQAVELFCRHAFKENIPSKGYEDLSYRAISYTGHLPLALKVLGSFLHGKEASVWESALNRLAKAPHVEIFDTLKLSFDGLDVSEKNIFLDIACFFKGKDREHVTRILDSFGFDPVIGISVLIEKSLVTVSNKKLGMHDLIQEMGWQIVRQSFSNSRLWEPKEFHDVIKRNKQKLKQIEAIVLPDTKYQFLYDGGERLSHRADAFTRMENLRLLDVGDLKFSGEPTFLPYNLQWLCWHQYPFSSLPVESMRKLVGLEMFRGEITHLWTGPKILPNLKFVHLGSMSKLTKFPDISGAPNIERLILTDCYDLMEVHESLGLHRKLVYLDMRGCINLRRLPSTLEMESLETLILSSCSSLGTFPEVSPLMSKLSNIYLDNCTQIKELPSSIRYLSRLRVLNLIGCEELKKLPKELGSMKSLEELLLGLRGMPSYGIWVPRSIICHSLTSLCSLRKLDLSYRQIKEEDFPQNFHAFSSLEELHLNGNFQITQLPVGISSISHLKLLALDNCCQLQNLHLLPSGIQVLRATSCSSLAKIGDLSKEYVWLYNIWLFDCHKLSKDPENEPHIDNMLHQNFLKKCAAVGHRLSIAVPGSKIPRWFEEQQRGCTVALRLPPLMHSQVIGFAICGVFHGDWEHGYPRIIFRIVNDTKVIPKPDVDHLDSSVSDKCNLWVTYMPFGFFQQMYQDFQPQEWSHIKGSLVMTLINTFGNKSVKCGAHVVYQEDMEQIQQLQPCISDYGKMVHIDGDDLHEKLHSEQKVSANTYVYEEKSDHEESKSTYVRTTTSDGLDVYSMVVGICACSAV
ncbi:hypothetical protein OSB04_029128 [Centaurea solstitialis]|uniref:ADP-ribosyl cyclase/cyclic ADP-ribose hydrolase n=1 Tax=Centaurea solstitialis TaxID=347529 RepID=A0AA38T0M5_9ASTR|nr:hypothetical protein OSB04_029128 [Centaurea solstitialis]